MVETKDKPVLIDVREALTFMFQCENRNTPYELFLASGNEQTKIAFLVQNWEMLKNYLADKLPKKEPEKAEKEIKKIGERHQRTERHLSRETIVIHREKRVQVVDVAEKLLIHHTLVVIGIIVAQRVAVGDDADDDKQEYGEYPFHGMLCALRLFSHTF